MVGEQLDCVGIIGPFGLDHLGGSTMQRPVLGRRQQGCGDVAGDRVLEPETIPVDDEQPASNQFGESCVGLFDRRCHRMQLARLAGGESRSEDGCRLQRQGSEWLETVDGARDHAMHIGRYDDRLHRGSDRVDPNEVADRFDLAGDHRCVDELFDQERVPSGVAMDSIDHRLRMTSATPSRSKPSNSMTSASSRPTSANHITTSGAERLSTITAAPSRSASTDPTTSSEAGSNQWASWMTTIIGPSGNASRKSRCNPAEAAERIGPGAMAEVLSP
jgi:hypothetical protein